MGITLRAIARAFLGRRSAAHMLDGFVDSLLQSFENCRLGLGDEALQKGSAAVVPFFEEIYAREQARLLELIAIEHPLLSEELRREMLEKIDSRIRGVLIPAYARVATVFTGRERNDFFLSPDRWHGLERMAFAVGGMAVGAFAVWAPFIPLWADEWILVFCLSGLIFPELRRVLALKRYETELNRLVEGTDDEIFRMDVALLTHESPLARLEARTAAHRPAGRSAESAPAPSKTREGGR